MEAIKDELPAIAIRELHAPPVWLGAFMPAPSEPCPLWSARFATLISQAAPALSCGLLAHEVQHVAEIIGLRLQLDLAGTQAGSGADGALDDWLIGRVVQSASWTAHQRRAWWQVERLSLVIDVLDRWTRRHFLDQPNPVQADETRLGEISSHWLDVAEECWNWGEDVYGMFAHRISENLLDCTWAAGHRRLMSLRRSYRQRACT